MRHTKYDDKKKLFQIQIKQKYSKAENNNNCFALIIYTVCEQFILFFKYTLNQFRSNFWNCLDRWTFGIEKLL